MAKAVGARGSSRSTLIVLGGFAALVVSIMLLAGLGGPHDSFAGLGRVIDLLLIAGWQPALYLVAAYGLAAFGPLTRGSEFKPALRMGLGLGLMLSISHAMGALGLLGKPFVALAPILVGLLLAAAPLVSGGRPRPRVNGWYLSWLPGVALLIIAASNPPGMLWDSEGRGYDALSYHLQLPQDWILAERIRPFEHNVYSYLPGYMEAAFYHLGLGSRGPGAVNGAWGLAAGDGSAIIACQYLSVGIAAVAAWVLTSLCRAVLVRGGAESGLAGCVSILAGAFFLATPWTTVTGSLAYNDLCVVALGGAGALAALELSLRPGVRGALCGLLVGFACGAKPTALLMAGPVVGMLLLGHLPVRGWARAAFFGSLCGVATLLPWLVRNYLHGGNPVFPMATGIFGNAHWTEEQVTRYAAAHMHVPLLEGLGELVRPGGRGLLHGQWMAFGPAVLVAGAAALVWGRGRHVARLLLAATALQVLAWLLLTHVQSRFLMPLLITGVPLIGAGLATLRRRNLAWGVAAVLIVAQGAAAVALFASQGRGRPNQLLVLGPGALTGELFRDAGDPDGAELRAMFENAFPQVFINRVMPAGTRLYLLGEARALYFTAPLEYNTTWDRWPLGEAMRRHPGDTAAWAEELRARGITYIFYNAAELSRLRTSGAGWSDPVVTPDSVGAFLQRQARLVRSWPESGCGLFELTPASDRGAAAP
jgi:hypothetical protein